MAFKFVVFAAFVSLARAGGIGLGVAPAISYSSISAPVASPLSYSLPAPSYALPQPIVQKVATPLSYSLPAPSYAVPQQIVQRVQPLSYSLPQPIVQRVQPLSYSVPQPIVQKVAQPLFAPQAYAQPLIQKVHAPILAPQTYTQAIATPLIQKVAAPVVTKTIVEAPAQYDFGYSVSDPHTGDIKEQHESRNGDVVQGSYSLVEADGTRRIVEYTADALQGFNAIVHKEPASVALKTVAPVAQVGLATQVRLAAPVAKIAAPLAAYHPQGVLLH
ncbi:unnamed protein product [Brassicogethes aeneus]|uniref:Cuticle protein n=1 Tax=Brassicogethes aeneus TaxID=1431903 RepID=A0A9P0AZE7_BRAAE|nr:unnamed protein product [Brassicogethes aeneus]